MGKPGKPSQTIACPQEIELKSSISIRQANRATRFWSGNRPDGLFPADIDLPADTDHLLRYPDACCEVLHLTGSQPTMA